MIPTPSLGRQVRYCHSGQERTATICFVWSDTVVNLCVIDHDGNPYGASSAALAETPEQRTEHGRWWWPDRS